MSLQFEIRVFYRKNSVRLPCFFKCRNCSGLMIPDTLMGSKIFSLLEWKDMTDNPAHRELMVDVSVLNAHYKDYKQAFLLMIRHSCPQSVHLRSGLSSIIMQHPPRAISFRSAIFTAANNGNPYKILTPVFCLQLGQIYFLAVIIKATLRSIGYLVIPHTTTSFLAAKDLEFLIADVSIFFLFYLFQ